MDSKESNMPKKKTILAKLKEEEQIQKLAQQTEGSIDPATADKMAEDIFDQLFEQTMEEAGVNKLGG